MHYSDTVLSQQELVAKDTFSMADITVMGGLIFAGVAGYDVGNDRGVTRPCQDLARA